jgi:hypothetical protein
MRLQKILTQIMGKKKALEDEKIKEEPRKV